jgi:hemolysin activation/secretion protein
MKSPQELRTMTSPTLAQQPAGMAAGPCQAHCRGAGWPARPALLVMLAVLAGPAWSQVAPASSGQLLEETRRPPAPALPPANAPRLIEAPVRPTIQMPEGVSVTVSGFRISGATSFGADELAALVQPWVGKRLDIRGLNEAAGALTRHYQSSGHLLSYAYLPAQRVADGVIELAVLEGRLEGIQTVTAQDVRLRDEVVQAHADPLTAPGPVLQAAVERKLLLLNDIPGVAARAAFTPGASTGGAEMVVSVAEDEPFEFRAEVNNHGGISTGVYRTAITLRFQDLFGWGDSTVARGMVSSRGGLVTGSLDTTVPIGGDGWKLGASLSHLKYQLAGEFQRLGAVGQADVIGVDASYPLRRTPNNSVYVRAGVEHKQLKDELLLIADTTAKRNDLFKLSGSADYRDSWGGVSAASATATLGKLRRNAGPEQEWRKLFVQVVRQQAITGPWSLYGRALAQTAGVTLDSSEKLGLAGADAVRAYAPGELSIDHGALASLELRYAMDYLGGSVVGSLFHDYGSGQINRGDAGRPGNETHIHGTGIGLSWAGNGIGLNASLAWRGSRKPTTDGRDPRPRLFLQMTVVP